MSKYVINSTTLTGIADAIREKAGTTAAIATNKMAESILAIKGGLSLDVVTATALPDTVTDGQIVVITETTPGTVYIDTDEPANPSNGEIWVQMETGAETVLDLSDKSPYIRCRMASANQWVGSAWQRYDAYLGADGVWEQFSYTLPPIGTSLNDMTWEDISKVALAGRGKDYFSVGDKKAIDIDGKVGSVSLKGTYYCAIIGIDHNKQIEEEGIHFQLVWADSTDETPYAFDASYSATSSTYYMHASTSNVGWEDSYMRKTLCAAFLAALPEEVQAVIRPCTKYTNNVGATSEENAVTATSDAVFLLSAFEVAGSQSIANSYEEEYQEQYAYYAAGNSPIKKRINNKNNACNWWTRSPGRAAAKTFVGISTTGVATAYSQAYNYGFAPAFRV